MARFIDVFNGDADGLCALHQLRLAEPAQTELVTGTKRDIRLLDRVRADAGDRITVLDVSLAHNREALMRLLAAGARVRYFDHHHPGPVPVHPGLEAFIDPSPGMCTSVLVDGYLKGRFRAWAVVAAFGDNLGETAHRLAQSLGLDSERVQQLRALGECLNYNAYGTSEADLLIAPVALYRALARYPDPFVFIAEEPIVARLREARRSDLAAALSVSPCWSSERASAYLFPDCPWSRRVIGEFANRLAQQNPHCAYAVIVPNGAGGYTVSVRAPAGAKIDAGQFCSRYPGGGGRPLAGGIDHLPPQEVQSFLRFFGATFG